MSKIDIAAEYLTEIAGDNTNGYSQPRRGLGKEDDCSSGMHDALEIAGFAVGSAIWDTATMLSPLLAIGFKNVASSINLHTGAGLRVGDILLRPKTRFLNGHTAMYIGNGKIVQFQGDFDGKPGDSSGREISIKDYYDSPFTYVLRAPAEVIILPVPAAPATSAHKVGENVIYSTCCISSDSMGHIDKGGHGKITRIVAGSRNPYLIGDGVCWVNDGDIRGAYVAPVSPSWKCGRMLKPAEPNMTGADVLALEIALEAKGYKCNISSKERSTGTGSYGSGCEAAVRAFQTDHPECGTNGKPDGKAGKITIVALGGTWTGK